MNILKNKTAVITGANSGIGLAIAKIFYNAGANVVVFDINTENVSNIFEKDKSLIIKGNLKNISDIQLLFDKASNKFKNGIDIIVASAGICHKRNLQNIDENFFDSIVDVNYKGTFFTVQKGEKHLNNNGSVILISSTAAHRTVAENSVYSSTKAAISKLAKSFAADLVDRKIRVNSISPGTIDTPMLGNMPKEFINKISNSVPMKKIGKPDDIAEYALFLASDSSSYITGTDIVIDGGLSSLH
jgi:NAD(P)-dependent dehydrogenase (short-subunit alcohol dehydrogenase family)